MASDIVAGELYGTLTGQLFEIGRQLRQPNGYPFNPEQLKAHLQAAIEGRFIDGEIYLVEMGGPETTDQIVAYLKSQGLWVNEYITSKLFPLTARASYTDVIEIVDPGRGFNFDECPAILNAAGLDCPTSEHWLRFARKYGTTTVGKKPYVVFPHEPVEDPLRNRRVGVVGRDPQGRRLRLCYPDGGFGDGCVLAGVRRAKQSQA